MLLSDIPIILFVNKVDLVKENDINHNEIQELVKKYNFIGYYITSAKTGQGVKEAFRVIIDKLYYDYKNR
ncbi:MAG: hypothetical protein P8Y70_07800 [Candidatus Lokiarchaeota archaeon]